MSVIAATPADLAPHGFGRVRAWLSDVWVMTRRNLIHIRREPMQLSDVTIQPVLFTLLFLYLFGSALMMRAGGSYKEFLLAGLLAMNLTTSTVGTAIGLTTDLSTGVIDRLRTLPMSPTSILIGRSISDLLASTLCATIVVVTGYCAGWRPENGFVSVLAAIGVGLLFAYGLSWMNACLGLAVEGVESAQGIVFIVVFPLAFVSNAFAPTQGLPVWLRTIATWNPVSAVTAAMRTLFGNPNPSAAVQAWPMQHPVVASIVWSLVLLAVCVPLAGRLYRHRTQR